MTKTAGLILHGPSLKDLDEKIEEFRHLDIDWISLNNFWIAESVIEKIGKRLDAVISLTDEAGDSIKIRPSLDRFREQGGTVLLTKDLIAIDKDIFLGNDGYPSAYFILLYLKKIGMERVFIFGGNGGCDSNNGAYYNQHTVPPETLHANMAAEYSVDTKNFNRLTSAPGVFDGMKIYNCCPESRYSAFEKITCSDAVRIIKGDNMVEWACGKCGEPAEYSDCGNRMCLKHWEEHLKRDCGNEKSFSIIFPTRERADLLNGIIKSIRDTAKHLDKVEVLIAYDDDDEISKKEAEKWAGAGFIRWFECKRSLNFSRDYYNRMAKEARGRFFIICNDDAIFETEGWDELVLEEAKRKSPKDDLFMGWIEDGLGSARMMSLANYCCFPMISRAGFKALGYVFPESIPTWGADVWVAKLYGVLGRIHKMPIVIRHLTPHNGTRPVDHVQQRIRDNQVPFKMDPTGPELRAIKDAIRKANA